MKSKLNIYLSVLMLAFLVHPIRADVPIVDPDELVPTLLQRQATRLITSFISKYHFKKTPLDDQLSQVIFDRYLEKLDPNRSYFLESDVQQISAYQLYLDDLLRSSRLGPVFKIFRMFRIRAEERYRYAILLLERKLDFSIDETHIFDRRKSPWATNSSELDEIWRKRVKNDVLTLQLAGKADEEIPEVLRKRYERLSRRVTQFVSEDVYQTFMNAYAGAVEPHTAYLSPRSSENFQIHLSLSLEGIGAALRTENEFTIVERVIHGGPADISGKIHAEDRITGVGQGKDGSIVDVVSWRLDDVVDLIRGPKGTVVHLELLPKGISVGGARKVITLERNKIKLDEQAAKKSTMEIPGGNSPVRVGVIKIPTFYQDSAARSRGELDYRSTSRDVRRMLGELQQDGVAGVVIDLRSNGGGSLMEAIQLTGLFIGEGPVVQVKNSTGQMDVEEDTDPEIVYGGPLVVLVNRYSASASEIFSGAIQDYGRGIVIGEPTYGKGTVQSLVDLNRFVKKPIGDLGQLKTTIAQFFRVNGDSTQHRGVIPDIVFPTAVDTEEQGERSLENALPWAHVHPANYMAYGRLSGYLDEIRQFFKRRVNSSVAFGLLIAEAQMVKEAKERNSVTLVKAKRRKERDAREATRKEHKQQLRTAVGLGPLPENGEYKETDEERERTDIWLAETIRVLGDLIRIRSQDKADGMKTAYQSL
ncbi:MAG: tail-specific protease [Gammaproteobacteria bacterium]|nr:tail-specific protease [Gammaproteobacteria bacterium]